MANTYTLIASSTVGSGGAANIDFTSIPSTYTDLVLLISARNGDTAVQELKMQINASATSTTNKYLEGNGASAVTGSGSANLIGAIPGTSMTVNTFNNIQVYIPNYAGSSNKSFSSDYAEETNATTAYAGILAGLWANTAAINRLTLTCTGNLLQHSTAYLYGIKNS
jgi:hypothetical protein